MSTTTDIDPFYAGVPVFRDFERLMDPSLYRRLPNDWVIGMTDVVQSTKAIAERRYKAVNMAGAAAIAAVANAMKGREFPFIFGGDGASFAVPPGDTELAREALAATAAWVRDDLGLGLRAALVPLAAVRASGREVRVARFAPSKNVSYAMFSGGGLQWAEAAMKRGEFTVEAAPTGTFPDLTGLSCRFQEISASRGIILSLVITAAPAVDHAKFVAAVEDIVAMVEKSNEAGSPVPANAPGLGWPPEGLELEALASRGAGRSVARRKAELLLYTLLAYLIFRFGIRVGRFIPQKYLQELVENSDFRKYDDALRMVIDCTPRLADIVEKRLAAAAAAGTIRYGLHRQGGAMMTCFTPSVHVSSHVHFIDGAQGGYAAAASVMKAMQASGGLAVAQGA
jgi:Protein of unknown function (DUF3095)